MIIQCPYCLSKNVKRTADKIVIVGNVKRTKYKCRQANCHKIFEISTYKG
jgi:DNA-directed RNA polymerase subunit RPC12/RpoP